MRGITGRFVLLIATAAVLPLVGYGLFSVKSLRSGTEQSVSLGNQAVAKEVAARIKLYFDNNLRVLSSIGAEVRGNGIGRIRLMPVPDTSKEHLLDFVQQVVTPGAAVVTDGLPVYINLTKLGYVHQRRIASPIIDYH